MGIRDKLLDFKRRLSDRHMYSIVIVVVAVISLLGLNEYKTASEMRQQLDNQYNRAFYDMKGYVQNVEVLLQKSLISGSPAGTASSLQEAWRQSNLAQTNLGQLPVSQNALASTSKFLSQVGDFSHTLNDQNIGGKSLTDTQYKTLENLENYATSLDKNLNTLQQDLTTGRLKWGDLAKKGTPFFEKVSTDLSAQPFQSLQKTFQNYPSLIYDGPFSDGLSSAAPKGLTGNSITASDAKKIAAKFLSGKKINSITQTGIVDGSAFKSYSFSIQFKNVPNGQIANMEVTQKGGHVLWMLYNRPIGGSRINMTEAKAKAKSFLDSWGIKNMQDTYYLTDGNIATINYCYMQNGVIVYPDMIKVKVALDNGEIIGFDSRSYLDSHVSRTITKPAISLAQAMSQVDSRVKILSTDMAIIPTTYNTELYTYELKGVMNNKDFIAYVNASTGKLENVLMIINTPNGVLSL